MDINLVTPKIAILMATYNGIRWLPEQVDSILNQKAVDVRLFVSDDQSDDGTLAWLENLASQNQRVTLLPNKKRFGSAGKNFYHLIKNSNIADYDYVAFADQDDRWLLNKLIRQVKLARFHGADGVSSSVVAFWGNGKRALIEKSEPQRKWDYLFESAGPGCTFLMSPWLISKVKETLANPDSLASDVELHDWLVYAICRASGKKWHIDASPTVQYRQHGKNFLGANFGISTKVKRLTKILDGWYRRKAIKISRVCALVSNDPSFVKNAKCITDNGLVDRFRLLMIMRHARRNFLDRTVLTLSILFFLF